MSKPEAVAVIFRKWKDSGEVIALFPEVPGDSRGSCMSYEHVGQHGAASYDTVIRATRPAAPDDYASLRRELEGAPFGYVFRVVLRESSTMRRKRAAHRTSE